MGFFDSKSSSNVETNTQNQSSGAQDEAVSIVSGGEVNFTDGNAIQNMFSVTMTALENQQKTAEDALGLNSSAMAFNNKTLNKSLSFAEGIKNPSSDNLKKIGLYFAVATVLVVVAASQFKG